MTLAVTNAVYEGEQVGLRAADGRIAELGPNVEPHADDEHVDAGGMALVPGLVNGHTHAAMTLFRGSDPGLPLMRWLEEYVWPIEAKLEDEDVYWGTRLACAEMVRTGTIAFWDMYWRPPAVARAVQDAGLRATVAAPLFDGADPSATGKLQEEAKHWLAELDGVGPQIDVALAPHAIYTVSEPSLRWIAEVAAERELPIHIHLSETEKEVADCVVAQGTRPAAYLESVGVLGPRTVLAHGVYLDDAELDLIAQRGATIVTNPASNMKLAVGGAFRFRAARDRGIAVGLGTDGAGTNDSLDLSQDAKLFALVQKDAEGDPTAVRAAEVLELARGRLSTLLGRSAELKQGGPADFLLLGLQTAEMGIGALDSNLVYASTGAVVDTTVVAGRVLMRGGALPEEEEILGRARERAARLGLGAG
ncbi:MAG: amidohydrolase [Solirubrobacterales bacterium]